MQLNNTLNVPICRTSSLDAKRKDGLATLTADVGKFMSVRGRKPKFALTDIIQHIWTWYTKCPHNLH